MDFPPDWDLFEAAEFELAVPRNPQDVGVELMAQVRSNGRILDHHKLVLGGASLLAVDIKMQDALCVEEVPAWTIQYNVWPRDIFIRRNMATSAWTDITSLLRSNDARIEDEDKRQVEPKHFYEWQMGLADKTANSFSVRWAVCAGEDGRVQLQLQCLPGPAGSYAGKPAFKG